MTKALKWLVFIALGLMLLLAVIAFTLHRWISTDDFRERVQQQASEALGVPVTLDYVAVDVWPLPAVALSGIVVQSKPFLKVGRLEMRPHWTPMLRGRLEVATLLVRRAVLPQQAIDGLILLLQKGRQQAGVQQTSPDEPESSRVHWIPERTVLDQVTWVNAAGARTTINADAKFGADDFPDDVSITLTEGNHKGVQATVRRDAPKEGGNAALMQWALRIDVGGGKVEGPISLKRGVSAGAKPVEELALQGDLQTKGVEVSALTAPAKALTGLLEATTTLSSRAATPTGLIDSLQSHTGFTVRNAVVNGVDLLKAVQTVGLSRGGQTHLDTLTGQVNSQGRNVQLSNLVASSGALSATGNVALSPAKALSGQLVVTVAGDSKVGSAIGGAVGVPLMMGGTLDSPEVGLSRGAMLGAAVGTVMMPGVGTGAGAKLGDRVGAGLRGLLGK